MVSRRCLFIDRDGVINVKQPAGQYVCEWSEFHWIPETIDWIKLFNTLGYLVIVVTNQRCVAKGLISRQQLDAIHAKMIAELGRQGAVIDEVLVCPHEIDSCNCRKPKPGLIHAACQRWPIDLAESILIGDSESDRQVAMNCGMRFVRVCDGKIREMIVPNQRNSSGVAHGIG